MGIMKAEIPPEITEYKEKMFFGMTVRQLICLGIGLGLAIPTGMFGSKVLPEDIIGFAIMLEVIPCACIGWLQINEMPFEKYAKKVIAYYGGNQKRKFKYIPEICNTSSQLREIVYQEELLAKKNNKKKKKR